MPYKDPDAYLAWRKKYYSNPKNREKKKRYNRERMRILRSNDEYKEKQNKRRRELRFLKKLVVLLFYSNGTLQCACCRIGYIDFLTLDHVRGGGQEERRMANTSAGADFCAWLIRMGLPLHYQILCFNCNSGDGFFEKCPHRREKIPIAMTSMFSPL